MIPRGYTLAATLEIADATLGGLALGVGMTTHAHKAKHQSNCFFPLKLNSQLFRLKNIQVGLYQETVVSYEVVLSDGSVVKATRDNEYSDLYHCLPWSHGTLGTSINSGVSPKVRGRGPLFKFFQILFSHTHPA